MLPLLRLASLARCSVADCVGHAVRKRRGKGWTLLVEGHHQHRGLRQLTSKPPTLQGIRQWGSTPASALPAGLRHHAREDLLYALALALGAGHLPALTVAYAQRHFGFFAAIQTLVFVHRHMNHLLIEELLKTGPRWQGPSWRCSRIPMLRLHQNCLSRPRLTEHGTLLL